MCDFEVIRSKVKVQHLNRTQISMRLLYSILGLFCSCIGVVMLYYVDYYGVTLAWSSAATFSKLLRKIFGRFLSLGKDAHFRNFF